MDYSMYAKKLREAASLLQSIRPDLPDVIATYKKSADLIDKLFSKNNRLDAIAGPAGEGLTMPYYYNAAGQRFPLPERPLEPPDCWEEEEVYEKDEPMDEPELTFDAKSHTYKLDGEVLPSVTQLTDIYSTLSLQEGDDLELTMEAAAERGAILHAYLERLLLGDPRECFELPDAYSRYADGINLFLMEHRLEPYLTETPMWGEADGVRFAGTPDFVGSFDGKPSILDWKFVSQVQKTKVGAQLSGYLSLCLCNDWAVDSLACVQFLPNGTYRVYPAGTLADSFYLCLKVWREKHKKHPRGAIA